MRDIRREVDLYLEAGRTRLRGDVQLYVKSIVAFAILAASWASLIFLHPGIVLGLVALGGLSLGTILVGFCIQHDANHGAYFRTRRANHVPKRWDLAGIVGGKLIFVGWAIVVPLFVYPWWVVVLGYTGFAALTSLVTATTFQLAHCVEEADFTSAEELTANRRVWAVHEVETTVDF